MKVKSSRTVVVACQRLRQLVTFQKAAFKLPSNEDMARGITRTIDIRSGMSNQADTDKIKVATQIYIDTWVLPIIEALEKGDIDELKQLVRYQESRR